MQDAIRIRVPRDVDSHFQPDLRIVVSLLLATLQKTLDLPSMDAQKRGCNKPGDRLEAFLYAFDIRPVRNNKAGESLPSGGLFNRDGDARCPFADYGLKFAGAPARTGEPCGECFALDNIEIAVPDSPDYDRSAVRPGTDLAKRIVARRLRFPKKRNTPRKGLTYLVRLTGARHIYRRFDQRTV
ncbi:hypothetical protein [Parvibaculum sedimenti]|uniref:hypothetical protein n=1 Tax=Parvibaculum sedimenti TaxID=2608632 RepID=UPI003BB6D410